MKSNALLAWGPIHDNQVGVPHNVDDDADSLAVGLSHMISDFETAAHPSLPRPVPAEFDFSSI
jgi:hypothetical protein